MKTVKEISDITGISIRTLRYYDEIGLLKPSELTDAGYRLYDKNALARLQEIMFFKELGLCLSDIKKIIENPDYDRRQMLLIQKAILEQKRNRLNGIMKLIDDVIEGVNTMKFEPFNDEDIKKIIDHSLELQDQKTIDTIKEKYGSIENFYNSVSEDFRDEKKTATLIKIYGNKDKAVEASLQATGNREEFEQLRADIDQTYQQFAQAMKTNNSNLATVAVEKLAENYKSMFHMDNARYLLLKVADDYLNSSPLEEATDKQYGTGVCRYIGQVIRRYYGVN